MENLPHWIIGGLFLIVWGFILWSFLSRKKYDPLRHTDYFPEDEA